jgi:hypothetical protein
MKCPPVRPGCATRRGKHKNLSDMVEEYIVQKRPEVKKEKRETARRSLERAIEMASMGETSDGKRSHHHYRRTRNQLNAGKSAVMSVYSQIRQCKNFEELHGLVKKITDKIDGLGELYTYDAAHIIGTQLGFHPKKVYLHTGTRKGARALGFSRGLRYIEVSQLPAEIQVLKAYEIEDFLCIYASDLKTWISASRKVSPQVAT